MMQAAGSSRPPPAQAAVRDDPYRVMLVDDSAVIRGLFARALESDPDIKVVASVGDGQMAIAQLSRTPVEVVVLDIEMPRMDGLTALPELIRADRQLQVVMASTLTVKNADVSMKALAIGAKDYIAKPSSLSALHSAEDFKRELAQKVKALGAARRRLRGEAPPRPADPRTVAERPPAAAARPVPRAIVLRAMPREIPQAIAIGSSTGGPQALFSVLAKLPASVTQPIFITQHMPATFTAILAEHLTRMSGRPAREAVDGEQVERGRIYVAPGDFHMVVQAQGPQRVIRLTKEPPENFCRPSVDPMLRSLAAIYGARLLTLILTGMGQDGLKGAEVVVKAGGAVVAQDEATSVVWGMPGAVATNGLCSAVLPLADVAPFLVRQATGALP